MHGRSPGKDTVERSRAAFYEMEVPAVVPYMMTSAAAQYVCGRRMYKDVVDSSIPPVDQAGRVMGTGLEDIELLQGTSPSQLGLPPSAFAAAAYRDRNRRYHKGLPALQSRKRVAVLGGAFHPLTEAHLLLVTEILSAGAADEVWVVPCGARPDKPSLTMDVYERFTSCVLAVESCFPPDYPVFVVPLEVFTPKALPTWELLSVLASTHPDSDFSLIIGSDNLESLQQWANADRLMRYCRFLCCPRPGYETVETAVGAYL